MTRVKPGLLSLYWRIISQTAALAFQPKKTALRRALRFFSRRLVEGYDLVLAVGRRPRGISV